MYLFIFSKKEKKITPTSVQYVSRQTIKFTGGIKDHIGTPKGDAYP